MKKSIQTIILDGGTNQSQKRELFKGAEFMDASYENNLLTLRYDVSGCAAQTEHRFFAVFDSRQSIPDKYLPAICSVSDQGVTLFILDVTHERIASNEKEQELVSFGNFLLDKYNVKMPIVSAPDQLCNAEVTHADIENWMHVKMGVAEMD